MTTPRALLESAIHQFNDQHGSFLARATMLTPRLGVDLYVEECLLGRKNPARIYPLVARYTLVFENDGPDGATIVATLHFGPHNGIQASSDDEAVFLAYAVMLKLTLVSLVTPALDAYIYERQKGRVSRAIGLLTQVLGLDPRRAINSPHLWLAVGSLYQFNPPPAAPYSVDHEWLIEAGVLQPALVGGATCFTLTAESLKVLTP